MLDIFGNNKTLSEIRKIKIQALKDGLYMVKVHNELRDSNRVIITQGKELSTLQKDIRALKREVKNLLAIAHTRSKNDD
ncbi:MAG: hypothetical protein COB66_01425 [Coxiella sp. (in: Bacteria)]|nr:MAG: hypothetical protein COB66_01425 [Coxiella sp. (in: g-proteobacteria)]